MSAITVLAVVLGVFPFSTLATDTVSELHISQYVGRWYEVYGDIYSDYLFQKNAKCITADCNLLLNKSVTVQNSGRLKSPSGELFLIKGYAYRPDDKEQGKLKVHLFGVPREGDYWVIQLGPPTYKGRFYQYSVVTDTSNLNLFVLARNVTQFREKFEATVLAKLEQQGFTKFYNKPSKIYQEDDCQYV
ncbi:uncharacterized protein [Dysidea avara]|uniref:uncharacterized protein isoform X2 n=1 Tax=Dysidea avara TaxID=196820 RepID=UPI003321F4C4